ncbi:hypothetical protein HOY34_17905 [Xinfangfangia sp. D13-10-4-6]|uniref:hypothetical protein n=1 Tax=Pseudogemmobacter hezensis TaxID=2737662 RepID=UPI0015559FF2|nr:hypothetical protein [Pseudogemmobacter hezensis]NPD17071.1 hypothetical protein [Pseudogemmobacter hezensis]
MDSSRESGSIPTSATTPMRGHRTSRISFRVRDLIDQAIYDVALDLKQSNAASVHRRHESLVVLENVKRTTNGLEGLRPVSRKPVSDHMQAIGVTALSMARRGERATVNARSWRRIWRSMLLDGITKPGPIPGRKTFVVFEVRLP